MAIMHNQPADFVSEIKVKVQFATHEEWQQDLGNGLLQPIIAHFDLVLFASFDRKKKKTMGP